MTRIVLFRSLMNRCVAGGLVCAFSALFASVQANAQAQAPEADLKAAIITNMLFFVDWPARQSLPTDQLTICYQNESPVAAALIRLDGKAIKGKLLKVIQLSSVNINQCLALYLAPGDAAGLGKTRALIGVSPVFLAADAPEYSRSGIMLNLEVVSGRVVFDVDLRSAQKAGFQVSSKVLRLARQVIE